MKGIADEIIKDRLRLVKVKEDFIAAACPFHKGGQETKPSFWINRDTGAWGCFSCSERGTDLSLLLKRLGVRNKQVEVILQEAKEEAEKASVFRKAEKQRKARARFAGTHTLPESLLGVYDWCPVSLLEEGFEEEILREHKIGFDRERERVTYPIRDIYGSLIGISGRSVVPGVHPKYKVYQGRHLVNGKEVNGELGEWFPDYSSSEIRNHLWRGHYVYNKLYQGEDDELVVVEGYKAALWLVQHGYHNTVALMGARMSSTQERLIRKMGTKTWIFLDNNEAGWSGTKDIEERLGMSSFPVYLVSYPQGFDEETQPSDLSGDELDELLSSATLAHGKARRTNGSNRA